MNRQRAPNDRRDEAWHRTLRRLTLYSWFLFSAAVVVAMAGSALIAWILTYVGFPFLATWLIIAAVILVVPLVTLGLRALRGG